MWNPHGSNFNAQDSLLSFVHIRSAETYAHLREKALSNEHSGRKPYIMKMGSCCSPRGVMSSYMGPEDMSSPKCLAGGHCLPLGGQSVWSLSPAEEPKPIVLLATAMDARSEFYDAASDGQNAGVRTAVLLAIAEALRDVEWAAVGKQVMIAFFEGEAWGRAGSRAFLSDVTDFECLHRVPQASSPFNDAMCSRPLRVAAPFPLHRSCRCASPSWISAASSR